MTLIVKTELPCGIPTPLNRIATPLLLRLTTVLSFIRNPFFSISFSQAISEPELGFEAPGWQVADCTQWSSQGSHTAKVIHFRF